MHTDDSNASIPSHNVMPSSAPEGPHHTSNAHPHAISAFALNPLRTVPPARISSWRKDEPDTIDDGSDYDDSDSCDSSADKDGDDSDTEEEDTHHKSFPASKLVSAASTKHEGYRGSTLGSVNLQLSSALRIGAHSILGGIDSLVGGEDDIEFGGLHNEEEGMPTSQAHNMARRVRINSFPEVIVYTPKTAMTDDCRSVSSRSSTGSTDWDIRPLNIHKPDGYDATSDCKDTPEELVAGPSGLPFGLRIVCRNAAPEDPEIWADKSLTVSPRRAGIPSLLHPLRTSRPTFDENLSKRKRKRNEAPGAPKAGVSSESDDSEGESSEYSSGNESRNAGAIKPSAFPGWAQIAAMRFDSSNGKRTYAKEGFSGVEGGGHATHRGGGGGVSSFVSAVGRLSISAGNDKPPAAGEASSGMKRSRSDSTGEQHSVQPPSERVSDAASESQDAGMKMARLTLSARSPHSYGDASPASSQASQRSRAGSEQMADDVCSPTSLASGTGSPVVQATALLGEKAELRYITSADGVVRRPNPSVS